MATFTDDFNRANSTDLGAGWVEVSGDWSIVSNQLSPGSAGGTIILRAAGAMATSDNYAQVTIAATTAASHGVWCRGNSNISSGYLFRNDGSTWDLFSVVGGSFTVIGTYAAAAAPGDVAKVQAIGSTIKAFVNGVERVSVTDTGVSTGTSVGIRSESTSAIRFDDFTGADAAASLTGGAALSATATLAATGQRAAEGATSLAADATLAASGQRGALGGGQCAATAALDAAGQHAAVTGAALAAAAGLGASGQLAAVAGGVLAATATLTAAGAVPQATLRGTATAAAPQIPSTSAGAPRTPTATAGV